MAMNYKQENWFRLESTLVQVLIDGVCPYYADNIS